MNPYQQLLSLLDDTAGKIRAAANAKGTAAESSAQTDLDNALTDGFGQQVQSLVNQARGDASSMQMLKDTTSNAGPSAVGIGPNGELVNAVTGAPLGVDSGLKPGEVGSTPAVNNGDVGDPNGSLKANKPNVRK